MRISCRSFTCKHALHVAAPGMTGMAWDIIVDFCRANAWLSCCLRKALLGRRASLPVDWANSRAKASVGGPGADSNGFDQQLVGR